MGLVASAVSPLASAPVAATDAVAVAVGAIALDTGEHTRAGLGPRAVGYTAVVAPKTVRELETEPDPSAGVAAGAVSATVEVGVPDCPQSLTAVTSALSVAGLVTKISNDAVWGDEAALSTDVAGVAAAVAGGVAPAGGLRR